jgi:Domain of unknown function (DUF5071)
MNLQELIPKGKHDMETARKLFEHSYSEVSPIVPQLLEWLQDGNWPVARLVADFLRTVQDEITDDIINVLKTNDDVWKYWCLHNFGYRASGIDGRLLNEIKRIAASPSDSEIIEGVHEAAVEITRNQT